PHHHNRAGDYALPPAVMPVALLSATAGSAGVEPVSLSRPRSALLAAAGLRRGGAPAQAPGAAAEVSLGRGSPITGWARTAAGLMEKTVRGGGASSPDHS